MNFINKLFGKKQTVPSKLSVGSQEKQQIIERWDKVEELEKIGRPSTLKEAVIEADKLIDYALDKIYPGRDSAAERLKETKDLFIRSRQDYENLWYAHKLRNELVHTIGFELPIVEAKNLLVYYKNTLKILGIL